MTFLSLFSCHPIHIFKNIPYSLGYRKKRLCSLQTTFTERIKKLSEELLSKGYNMKVLKAAFNRLKEVSRLDALKKVDKEKEVNKFLLILSFDPRIKNPTSIMKKHYNNAMII